MSQALRVRNLATRITSGVTRRATESGVSPAFYACMELRSQLTTLVGVSGYRALLARALVLASPEARWLNSLQIGPDGALEGLNEFAERLPPEELAAGGLALLSRSLELLMAFVGEGLTLRLVSEVWPKVSLTDPAAGGD